MELNYLQQKAFDIVIDGKNIFITGPGGTGKTKLILYIVYYLRTYRCPDTHSVQHIGDTKDNRTPLIETYKIPPTKKLLASGFKI